MTSSTQATATVASWPCSPTSDRAPDRLPRRSFTPEFKAEIVGRCQAGDRTVAQVVPDFDLTETAVRSWVNQADAGSRDGLSTSEREELSRLRQENRRLQADVDLLKRASPREVSDAELAEKIKQVWADSDGTYGSPRVHHELLARGAVCGRRRVRRLMRIGGREGRCKKRWRKTTIADPAAQTETLDLLQGRFGPGEVLDAVYVGDITYIATWEGWAYLATVIDLASRRVVRWTMADHMGTELIADALDMAVSQRRQPAGATFHSGRGCQNTSHR